MLAFANFLLGDLLQGSEWTDLVSSASIRTTGPADAIRSASHVKKATYFHQVNAVVLQWLLMEAYDANKESYDVWLAGRRNKSPNFEYWFTCLEIGCLMLLFVQSITSDNFEMFVSVLDQFAPWLFALDHISYATCIYSVTENVTPTAP